MESNRQIRSCRTRTIDGLSNSPLDVLVVGGGIIGAGIVRDAAMRGLRVGLIEQHDFAWGTSSRSSRLLHGGIRYLAQARLGLVRQASLEKVVIGRIAPHLAAPLPFIFPTYRKTAWPLWKLRIGVRVYDLLCGGKNLGSSSALDVPQVQQRVPGLSPNNLTGAVRFFDGATNDARLVIDTLRSAARHGGLLCNYLKLAEANRNGARWRCLVHDVSENRQHHIETGCVVNATGPWAGQFRQSRIHIRGTKGIHIVLDRDRLPLEEGLMMTNGRRVTTAIPWGERVYMGTTDTDYDGPLDEVRSGPEDVAYLLAILNQTFPGAALAESDVLRTWAGVRPLIADPRGTPSDVSRSHEIRSNSNGWIDVAGGKLTTYRLIAEQVVNQLLKQSRREARACRTAHEPLVPESEARGISGIVPPPVNESVVEHACTNEWALHLDDVMVRRTRWHLYHRDVHAIAGNVADWMARCLDWSNDRRDAEIRRYERVLD